MIRSILFCLFSMLAVGAQADQQAILTKEEAEKTVAFLESHEEIILFCGCCSNDTRDKILISRISYDCEYVDWCQVRVEGVNTETSEEINTRIDLAYTWVNVNGVARNLAWEVGLNASPCASPFDWETYKEVKDVPDGEYSDVDAVMFRTNFKEIKSMLESNVGFEHETFESGKQFIVEKVSVDQDALNHLLIVSHIGNSIEQRYTIPLDKVNELTKNSEGIELKTIEDGVIIVEEFEDAELKFRSFYVHHTLPIPGVDLNHLKYLGILVKTHFSMGER